MIQRLLAVMSLLALAIPALGQTRPAPFYSLPANGTWVEFEWVQSPLKGNSTSGTLRLSSVGRKDVDGMPHRWIEIKLSTQHKDEVRSRYRKLLVEEGNGKAVVYPDAVRQGFGKESAKAPVTRLNPKTLDDLLGMGLPADSVMKERAADQALQTKLGRLTVRHVVSESKTGPRGYHGWLTDKVPFGCAKFEIREDTSARVTFQASIIRSGENARSEVDEATAK